MASYTPTEMEFLQQKGNEFCRLIWLGLWDARSSAEPESRDEQKVKDFMAQKYERKRWYVPPEQAAVLASQKQKNTASETPEPKPLKQLLGKDAPSLQVNNSQSPSHSIPAAVRVSQPPTSINQPAQPQQTKPSVDLLGELGGDPFGSGFGSQQQQTQSSSFEAFGTSQQQQQQQPQQQQSHFDPFGSGQQSQGGGFADFGSAFSQQSSASFGQHPASSAGFNQPTSTPAFSGGGGILQPGQRSGAQQNNFGPNVSSAPIATTSQHRRGDKYAALSELDTLFHDTTSSINWAGTPPSSGGMFGSSSGGVVSSAVPQSASLGNMGTTSWAGGSTMTSSGSMGNVGGGGGSTNPFMATSAASGFSQQGSPATSSGFGQPTANPFLAQSSGPGFGQANGSYGQMTGTGYGTQQPGIFGQQPQQQGGGFGTQQSGGFGQQHAGGFGVQQSGFGHVGGQGSFGGSMGGFGQPQQQPQQNLSFGGAGTTAMASNQFAKMGQQQLQQQQQQFGGWAQPTQPQQMNANPFMSGGQSQFAARNTTGNPFL